MLGRTSTGGSGPFLRNPSQADQHVTRSSTIPLTAMAPTSGLAHAKKKCVDGSLYPFMSEAPCSPGKEKVSA